MSEDQVCPDDLCDDCNHPIRLHRKEGCEFELGDRWVTGSDGTEGLVAMGPCACRAWEIEDENT